MRKTTVSLMVCMILVGACAPNKSIATISDLSPLPTVATTEESPFRILGERPNYSPANANQVENLFVVNVDDASLTQVTHNQEKNFKHWFATWSPDGKQILFTKVEEGLDDDIYVINSDGSNLRQLTNNEVDDSLPVWSPDGQQFAFVSNEKIGEPPKIFLMKADGSELRRLTRSDEYCEFYPAWSPNGEELVYSAERCSEEEQDSQLRVINVDGTNERRLTPMRTDIAAVSDPRWSPDGQWISYNVELAEGGAWFNLISPDGKKVLEPRSTEAAWFEYPVWSPDGTRVVFVWEPPASPMKQKLGIMDIPALSWHRLDYPGIFDRRCWLPNGRQIAFYSDEDDSIWIIDEDGSNPHKVAEHLGLADCTPKRYIP